MINLRFTPCPMAIVVGGFASSNVIGTDRVAASTTRPTETSRVAFDRACGARDLDLRHAAVSDARQMLFGHRADDVDAVDGDDAVEKLALFDRRARRHRGFGDDAGNRRAHDDPLAGVTGALAGPAQLQMLKLFLRDLEPRRRSFMGHACLSKSSLRHGARTRETFDACQILLREPQRGLGLRHFQPQNGALAETIVAGNELHERASTRQFRATCPAAARGDTACRRCADFDASADARFDCCRDDDDLPPRLRIDLHGREVERPLLLLQERRRALFVVGGLRQAPKPDLDTR